VIRHCDGTDDNLTQTIPVGEFDPATMTLSVNWDRIAQHRGEHAIRCACGRSFDDVDRLVTWPHEPVLKLFSRAIQRCSRNTSPHTR
jgi:hypothetical protein